MELDEALGGEPAERLAKRRSRDAERVGERLLAQLRAAAELSLDDPPADLAVDPIDDGLDLQRLDAHAAGYIIRRLATPGLTDASSRGLRQA